jgi:hypothetical protein
MKHCTLLALPLCLLLALSGCDMPGADDAGEMPDNAMFDLEGMWHYSEVTEPCYNPDGTVVEFERGAVKLRQYQGAPHDSAPNLEFIVMPPIGRVLRGHLRGDLFSLTGRIDYLGRVCLMNYYGQVTSNNYLWGEEIISSCDHPTSGEPIFLRCAATVMLRVQ